MGEKFIDALRQEDNWKQTENYQDALKSTLNDLVDLFGTIGALRNRGESDIIHMFSKAFAQDKLLAMKMLFYARNIRGLGLGERRTFRIITKWLATVYPDTLRKNLQLISFFGRWDDLYEFVGTPLEKDAFTNIKEQFDKDIQDCDDDKPISLLAKWLKSINTSNEESNKLGKLTAKYLGLTEMQYRKTLSKLRKHLKVVEKDMCSNEWENIDYPTVPSRAMLIYQHAFLRHDLERFTDYMEKLKTDETSIRTATLYPYDLVAKIIDFDNSYDYFSAEYNEIIEAQWKALPNYIEGENNILVMADTSGSMFWAYGQNVKPINISIGLAIYFAERNKGVFQNKFITFSRKPSFVELKGNTLSEKIRCIPRIVENTNIEAAFNLVLKTAIKNNLKNEDLPKSIVIISDMEFDECQTDNSEKRWTFYDAMKNKYKMQGFQIPNIVFWNVEVRNNTFHTYSDYEGVQIASGASASVFKALLNNENLTPERFMLEVLNDPIFDCIII